MSHEEKKISYSISNTYSTLNELGSKTKNIWFVLHGMGYLSRYFINYFDGLPPEENYIIAPQAQSKYYLNNKFKHVGASWLTKENTEAEIENVLRYLDTVFSLEVVPSDINLIVFGFSQGVSVATRWVSKRKIKCQKLVCYAGGLPNELKPEDFYFFQENYTEVIFIVGDKDEYLTPERMDTESKKIDMLFQNRAKKIVFEGGHELKRGLMKALIE